MWGLSLCGRDPHPLCLGCDVGVSPPALLFPPCTPRSIPPGQAVFCVAEGFKHPHEAAELQKSDQTGLEIARKWQGRRLGGSRAKQGLWVALWTALALSDGSEVPCAEPCEIKQPRDGRSIPQLWTAAPTSQEVRRTCR